MNESLVSECLKRIGILKEKIKEFEIIETGRSGASVIQFCIGEEYFILKFTSARGDHDLYINARRERRFYEEIRPLLTIRVPDTIGSFEDGAFGIGVCMRALKPAPPPSTWRKDLVRQAITQIASLHAAYWNRCEEIYPLLSVEQSERFEHRKEEIDKSAEAWKHVFDVMKDRGERPTLDLEAILLPLRKIRDLSLYESELPYTLVHGDFHMENCLIAGQDEIAITDWQSPGVGSGPAEIGYFLARAELCGSIHHAASIIDIYEQELNVKLPEPVKRQPIERILHSKRLSVHLFWSPRYVLFWPRQVLDKVQQAIHESMSILELS